MALRAVGRESDCSSRGRKFDPSLVQYFVEIDHENDFCGKSPPYAYSRRVVVSYKQKNVHIVLINHLVKLAQKKV